MSSQRMKRRTLGGDDTAKLNGAKAMMLRLRQAPGGCSFGQNDDESHGRGSRQRNRYARRHRVESAIEGADERARDAYIGQASDAKCREQRAISVLMLVSRLDLGFANALWGEHHAQLVWSFVPRDDQVQFGGVCLVLAL